MSPMERSANAAATPRPPRIRWQFDSAVPTSDFLEGTDLATDIGLSDAIENFVHEMQSHRFHAWEGVICREQGIPLTAEQEEAADGLICFGPSDDEDPSVDSQVSYIDEIPRTTEPWYEVLRQITARLLLDPFDVTAPRYDVHCDAWNELEKCLVAHTAGLSLPEGVATALDVIPTELRHRLRLQYCFHALPNSGYENLSIDDPDSPINWFVNDLQESREAIEQLDLTLDSLLTMLTLPEDELPHFVRVMKQRLGIESTKERMARRLFSDSS